MTFGENTVNTIGASGSASGSGSASAKKEAAAVSFSLYEFFLHVCDKLFFCVLCQVSVLYAEKAVHTLCHVQASAYTSMHCTDLLPHHCYLPSYTHAFTHILTHSLTHSLTNTQAAASTISSASSNTVGGPSSSSAAAVRGSGSGGSAGAEYPLTEAGIRQFIRNRGGKVPTGDMNVS